jgi:hypothetical protein
MQNAIEKNGIAIVRTPTGVGVGFTEARDYDQDTPYKVEIDLAGRRWKEELIPAGKPWRDAYPGVDMTACAVRVKRGDAVLVELGIPETDEPFYPFMVLQGEQVHITEAYVSVPPALHITDEVGAIWTLGMRSATRDLSPEGEFAFHVLRDGVSTHEIASRIERRNGKIRVLTKAGYKVWTQGQFFF